MRGKRTERTPEEAANDGMDGLKKAVIAFAIIEALVLIPVLLYITFR